MNWTKHLCRTLLLLACLWPLVAPAGAAEAADSRFGFVWRLRGELLVAPANGRERALREGEAVFIGDTLRATKTGEAVVQTDDGGMIAIRPGAEFVVEHFRAQGDPQDSLVVRLLTGSLRVITGWIGKTNPRGNLINTATATIGIRGTDHEPYVLDTDRPAGGDTLHRAGTYDKVNRGATTLLASGTDLTIDAGRVGFARAPGKGLKSRALMTLLLPVLLERVPDFYVPGAFDAELDRFAQTSDVTSARALATKQTATPANTCDPQALARAWLDQLDQAISRGDAAGIIGLFAPEVAVRAAVRGEDGQLAEIDLGREELAKSTLAAVAQLQGYQHRRISVEASRADLAPAVCKRLQVSSVVVEEGRMSGKPYRFDSLENFVLELRDGQWLAVKAQTRQN
jgi:hypothetical protein